MKDKEQDTESFLRTLEEENGGPLEWRTYAFFIGASGDLNPRSLGGLIYVAAGKIAFEDFERENSLMKLIGRKKTYEKFKIEAPLSSIEELRSVSASGAKRVILGKDEARGLAIPSGIGKFVSRRTEAVIFRDGSAWFFEMYDREGLRQLL